MNLFGFGAELMLLGFISLLLTVGQGLISRICISKKVASTWHPCRRNNNEEPMHPSEDESEHETSGRRLLAALLGSGPENENENPRRILAAGATDQCAAQVS